MEPKSGSRAIKKSAGGGVLGDRKKSRQKKKKEKRKASVKGTESTDVPSPELDSEVPLDGDVVQDGQTSPAGPVTRFPQLNSQSSVSLTTQTSTPPPILVTPASRKVSLGGQTGSSSAPTTRSAAAADAAAVPASTLLTPAHRLDGVVARVASLNIKQRSSKPRNKAQAASSKSSSKSRTRNNNNQAKSSQASSSSKTAGSQNGSAATTSNESLRWEMVLEDAELERERIAVYKMNRRKRYLAAAQAKGLGWAMNYNTQTSVTPMSEDSGVETACGSPGVTASSGAYIDFSSMQTLRPIPAHRGLQEAFVEC